MPFSRVPGPTRLPIVYAAVGLLCVVGVLLRQWLFPRGTFLDALPGWLAFALFVTLSALVLRWLLRLDIEQRERDARRTGATLDGALSVLPDACLVVDTEALEVVRANPAAGRIFRYTEGKLAGLPVEELHPEGTDVEELYRQALEVAEREGAFRTEGKMERQDGSTFPAGFHLSPVRDGSLDERRAVVFVHDVTRRTRAEEALQKQEQRFRTLISNISDVILVVDPSGKVLYESPSLGPVLGYWPKELQGQNVHEYVHRDDGPRLRRMIRKSQEKLGKVEAEEFRFRHRNGDWRLLEAMAKRPRGETPVEDGIVLTLRDVTGRREAEEALRKSKEKYLKIFRISPLSISIETQDEGKILEVNEGFEELFGFKRNEVVGRTDFELEIWEDPEDREQVVQRVRETGTASRVETLLRTKSGRSKHALIFAERIVVDGQTCLLVVAHDITERKAAERKLEQQALFDSLSGLPNRNLFHDRLEHALERARRQGTRVALLYMDLDRFKIVNDTLGHAAGDQLLSAAAQRILECFRQEDTVARLGGDEFAALLEEAGSVEEARAAAERLVQAMEPPFDIAGTQAHVTVSIGIAVSSAAMDGPTDLLRYGDIAMYRAKEREGTTFHVFDARSDSEATQRLHHENELREALDLEQLRVHYQPIVELETGQIRGAEALVRWEHPERGILKPLEFIPLAEETGLIVPLGDWVLRETTRQVSAWKERFSAPDGFSLSVNLSPYQFREPDLLRQAAKVLKRSGLSARDLQLEITESMVIQGKAKIEELSDLGLRVAIDDFGTGYSSLNYLKRLRVDSLKIDRSFVDGLGKDEEDDAIVRTILILAERLELEVIAEGVETREQLQHLADLGCELGQGYYFARPVNAREFETLLQRNKQGRPELPSASADSVEAKG